MAAILCALFSFSLTLTTSCRTASVATVPDITLPDVRGGQFHLRSQPAQLLLIAFLQTVPDTSDTPSRSQVVFLASMAQQYGPRGLRVAAVDATALAPGGQGRGSSSPELSLDDLRNAGYDWQLKFPLLIDRNGDLARALGVDQVPTTFLISAPDRILHRWRGFTPPAVFAESIEEVLGGPLAKRP